MPFRTSGIPAQCRGGDTEDTHWDDAVKYRIIFGPAHFAAMGESPMVLPAPTRPLQPGDTWTADSCEPLKPHNTAYGFDIGAGNERVSGDVVYQRYSDAISVLNPLLGPTSRARLVLGLSVRPPTASINLRHRGQCDRSRNTLYGIVTDNKPSWALPSIAGRSTSSISAMSSSGSKTDNPFGVGATDQGGYLMSGVENTNLDSTKLVNIWWTGKILVRRQERHHPLLLWQVQNDFRRPFDLLDQPRYR